MLVNQILSGNIFMTAEKYRPIKIKDLDILSRKNELQNHKPLLFWNSFMEFFHFPSFLEGNLFFWGQGHLNVIPR